MIKTLKPVAGYVLIEPTEEQTTSEGGIVLTSVAADKTKPNTVGIVRAVGHEVDSGLIGQKVSFVIGATAYEKAEVVGGVKMLNLPIQNIVGYVGE